MISKAASRTTATRLSFYSLKMSDNVPFDIPSLTDILRILRSYAPAAYRLALFLFALVKQVPFIGPLLGLVALYMAFMMVWNAVASTIRTTFRLVKWISIAGAVFAFWSALSGDIAQQQGVSSTAGQEIKMPQWADSLLNQEHSQSQKKNKRRNTSSAGSGSTSRRRKSKDSEVDLSGMLQNVVQQAGMAASWMGASSDGWRWVKEQWDQLEGQASQLDSQVDQQEKRKKSWW